MKYWLLTSEYPPFHGGGISTYAYQTAKMLSDLKVKVTVFVQDNDIKDVSEILQKDYLRIIRFNPGRNKLSGCLGAVARLSYEFAQVVREFSIREGCPDFIETQDYLGIGYYLLQYKQLGYPELENTPVLITLHSPAFIYLEYNRVPTFRFPDFWTCEMEKQAIVAADALVSPTEFMSEEIGKYLPICRKGIAIINNPFEPMAQKANGFLRNKIVFYGKLSRQKGSFKLLEYFKRMWDRGFQHSLHIIGGTDIVFHPERRTMGQVIEEKYKRYINNGLLFLHGKIKPDALSENLQDAHVIIVPSIIDNMPYVVLEAMALGKIVLVSKQGGQQEIVTDGLTGFIFDHLDESSFGEKLAYILNLNDTEAGEIGSRAREFVLMKYGFKAISDQKLSFLNNLKANYSPGNSFSFVNTGKSTVHFSARKDDLLSIVIPYYNMGKYISECVASVLNSSHDQIEILIINDGSDDEFSLEKLKEFSGDGRISIWNQENKGVAESRNKGAMLASGTFLAFLDADDTVHPQYYEKALRALKKNDNVCFIGCWTQYFGNSHRVWPGFTPQAPYILVHNSINSSSLVYKRTAFLASGLNDSVVDYGLEDYESVVNMMKHGLNGVVLPEVLFYYRVRNGSMIRNITREKLLYSTRYIADKHFDYYAIFASDVINLLNANGPGYLFDNPTLSVKVRTIVGNHFLEEKIKSVFRKNNTLKRMAIKLKNKIKY